MSARRAARVWRELFCTKPMEKLDCCPARNVVQRALSMGAWEILPQPIRNAMGLFGSPNMLSVVVLIKFDVCVEPSKNKSAEGQYRDNQGWVMGILSGSLKLHQSAGEVAGALGNAILVFSCADKVGLREPPALWLQVQPIFSVASSADRTEHYTFTPRIYPWPFYIISVHH